MKKVMLLIIGMLFSVSATAATVNIVSTTSSGGGSTANGNGAGGATATHTNLLSDFEDIWQVTLAPAASETFNVATSTPTFTTFDAFYSFDGGSSWVDFTNESILPTVNESEWQTLAGTLTSYLIKVTGTGVIVGASSYLLSITDTSPVAAVPVPAALFLFAPALLGFLGLRRKAAVAA